MDAKNKPRIGRQKIAALLQRFFPQEGKQSLFLSRALRALALALFSFFVAGASVLPGAKPFSFALLSALPGQLLPALVGAILRGLTMGADALVYVLALGAVCLARTAFALLTRESEGEARALAPAYADEGVAMQIILAAASSLTVGIAALVHTQFAPASLLALLVSLALQPPLVIAVRCAFDPDFRFSLRSEAGQAVLTCALVLSLADFPFLGFSLQYALGFFLTLYVAKTGGMLRGGTWGMLIGTVCSPLLSPVLGISGLICGLLSGKSQVTGALSALGCGMLLHLRIAGITLLSPAPDFLLGTVAYLALTRLPTLPAVFTYASSPILPKELLTKASLAEADQAENEARLSALTESLTSLSHVFYKLSDRMKKPAASEVRYMIEDCMKEHCLRCPRTALCFVREQTSTADAITKMTLSLCREGILSMADVPSYLRERCTAMPKIIANVNDAQIDALEKAARQDKLEVLALDYRAMAALLSHACRTHAAETAPDPVATKELARCADAIGLCHACLSVIGKRRKQIIAGGVTPGGITLSPNEIKTAFSQALSTHLTPPRFDLEGEYVTMTLTTARRFEVDVACTGMEKQSEPVSGDSAAYFENREDFAYLLISDGMGSGREAALTSGMCTTFLRTMLSAGNSRKVAIEMLNNFIRNKNMECSCTVDLLEIDLLSGSACFVKCGGAPSFVLRDGKLFKIASTTLPIGITREIRCEEVHFDLCAGDIVVMMSDGVMGDGTSSPFPEGGLWLADMLTFDWEEGDDIHRMAEKLLKTGAELGGKGDDMSVMMVEIKAL